MNYKPRPGIVSTTICNTTVLVPSREAYDACKTILPLSLLGTIIWAGIERDLPIEDVMKAYRIFVKKTDEELAEMIDEFCRSLCEKGYALAKDPDPNA